MSDWLVTHLPPEAGPLLLFVAEHYAWTRPLLIVGLLAFLVALALGARWVWHVLLERLA